MDRLLTDAEIYETECEWLFEWSQVPEQYKLDLLKAQDAKTIKWVIGKIDKSYLYLKSLCLAAEDDGDLARGYDIAMNEALSQLATLKAELEGEGLVLEHGCRYLNSEFECEKRLLIKGKCPSECIYYDDGSR